MHRILRSLAGRSASSSALGRAATAVSSTLRLGEAAAAGNTESLSLTSATAGHPASPSNRRRPAPTPSSPRASSENRLHLGRALKLYDNAISQCGIVGNTSFRSMTTAVHSQPSPEQGSAVASPDLDQPQRIKFKRLDKTAKHIMNILDKEAVEKVRSDREIPDIRPGYIIQMKVEVPENKRRVSSLKGIVIAKRNAGLNSTFRLRRLVAGVGVESVFPLYSPNIKEIKVVDKKKVRRAKLYYLRDRMNALKK